MSNRNICTGTKKDGSPCGMINTLAVVLDNGAVSNRCRQHRDGLTIAGTADVGQPMPSTKFRSRADAERFTEWVLQQGAQKRMNAALVGKLMDAVKAFNKLRERMENDLFEEYNTLFHRAADQLKHLRELADQQEGLD